jgi:nucleoside-diphosphate-sugar epimerase
VLRAARELGAVVVTASTCKACNPETAYGASKLIAERLTLNAGQRVARFFNVLDSDGNVFEIWRDVEAGHSIEVAGDSLRYGITLEEAVALTLRAACELPGRYIVDPGSLGGPAQWASRLYPNRPVLPMERRRGDRQVEPLIGACERARPLEGKYDPVWQVTSEHD